MLGVNRNPAGQGGLSSLSSAEVDLVVLNLVAVLSILILAAGDIGLVDFLPAVVLNTVEREDVLVVFGEVDKLDDVEVVADIFGVDVNSDEVAVDKEGVVKIDEAFVLEVVDDGIGVVDDVGCALVVVAFDLHDRLSPSNTEPSWHLQ